MEYLFGVVPNKEDNTQEQHFLRVKDKELKKFIPGTYYIHTDNYPDMIVTDSFKIDKQIKTDEDSEGNHYAWYLVSEYSRSTDNSPGVAAKLKSNQDITAINFVSLAEQGTIDDVTASEHSEMFAEWNYPINYTAGQIRKYEDKLYKCISPHKSQVDWTPDKVASLWKAISDPNEEWPEWSRPIGAFDAYMKDDKVSYNGKHYISLIDNNVWAPDEYTNGWSEVN